MEDPWKMWSEFLEGDEGHGKGKEVEKGKKVNREEEQKEYEVEEGLDDVERVKYFLQNRRPLQVKCALEQLKHLWKSNQDEVEEKVLPVVSEVLLDKSNGKLKNEMDQLLLIASELVTTVHSAGFLTTKAASEHVLPLAMVAMASDDSEVRLGWRTAFEGVMGLLDRKVIEAEILPFALESCQVSKPGEVRLVGASLLGPISRSLPTEVLLRIPAISGKPAGQSTSIFKKGLALCQDTDHIVRGCMCQQLCTIAQAFTRVSKEGLNGHKSDPAAMPELDSIKDEILELLRDEEQEVREAAVSSIVELLQTLPGRLKAPMIDALTEVYEKAKKDSEDLAALVHNLGPLAVQEWKSFADKQTTVFRQFMSRVAGSSNNEARAKLAYNLPGLLLAIGASKYQENLHNVVNILAKDSDTDVRIAMARSMEGVTPQLELPIATTCARDVCLTLMRDKDREVRLAIIKGLPQILKRIAPGDDKRNEELLAALSKLHEEIQGNHAFWRQEICLIEAIDLAGVSFSPSQVQDTIVPSVLRTLSVSSPQVVPVAIRALLRLLRISRSAGLRADVCHRLNREWGRATSYTKRMIFCDICMAVLEHFSRNFFKYFFIDTALEILRDSVPNVRGRACRLLPAIKQSLKLPYDAVLLENLINSMMRLLKDKDSDVVIAARHVSEDVNKMEELKPLSHDPEDDAKRADEDLVHGHLERKHHKNTHALDLAADAAHKALPLKGSGKGGHDILGRKNFHGGTTSAIDTAAARKIFTGNTSPGGVRQIKLGAKNGSFTRARSTEGNVGGSASAMPVAGVVRRAGSSGVLSHTAHTGKTSTAATAVNGKGSAGAIGKSTQSSASNGKTSHHTAASRFGGLPTGPIKNGSKKSLLAK